jgi:DUF1680 family protein
MRRVTILIMTAVLSLSCSSGLLAQDRLKAQRVENPIPIDSFDRIGGFIGQRIAANVDNYIKRFDIERYVQAVERRDQRDWSWVVGEQPGKWLESAALNAAWMNDPALRQSAASALRRLARSQEASGYLGVTAPDVRTPAKPLRGMDPYELYFMMHGLLTAAEEWNDEEALQTARRLGDYFESTIGPGKAEFWPSDLLIRA